MDGMHVSGGAYAPPVRAESGEKPWPDKSQPWPEKPQPWPGGGDADGRQVPAKPA